jgi:hypothetical protein
MFGGRPFRVFRAGWPGCGRTEFEGRVTKNEVKHLVRSWSPSPRIPCPLSVSRFGFHRWSMPPGVALPVGGPVALRATSAQWACQGIRSLRAGLSGGLLGLTSPRCAGLWAFEPCGSRG